MLHCPCSHLVLYSHFTSKLWNTPMHDRIIMSLYCFYSRFAILVECVQRLLRCAAIEFEIGFWCKNLFCLFRLASWDSRHTIQEGIRSLKRGRGHSCPEFWLSHSGIFVVSIYTLFRRFQLSFWPCVGPGIPIYFSCLIFGFWFWHRAWFLRRSRPNWVYLRRLRWII